MRRTILAAGLAALLAWPAVAQPQCGPRAGIVAMLTERYGEQPVAHGLTAGGAIMEMWADPDSGSWAVTAARPNGAMCLVGAGGAFEALALEPAGTEM